MTITYPRELPDYKLVRATFKLIDGTVSSVSHKGSKINISQIADPTWTLDIETRPMWDHERRVWAVWKNSLRGGLREFVAYDKTRRPLAYPSARNPGDISAGWDGTANVTSLGEAGLLSLSGLPLNYVVSIGDRIGLEEGGAYGYYEVLEEVVAVAGSVTVAVVPFLHTGIFTTAATARLWDAKCKFRIDWQSWNEETVGGLSPVSFTAYQRVMA